MATEVQIALQPQAGQDPVAALTAAAAKLARQSLEMLVQQAGRPLTGQVVPPPPNLPAGMAQIAVADMVLTLKLSAPLPPGTPVRIDVQQTAAGKPQVVVQPMPTNASQPPPAVRSPAPQQPVMPQSPPAASTPQATTAPVQPQTAPATPAAPSQQAPPPAAIMQTAVSDQAVVTAPQPRSPAPAQPAATSTLAPSVPQAAGSSAPVPPAATPAPLAPAPMAQPAPPPSASVAAPATTVASPPSPQPAAPVVTASAPPLQSQPAASPPAPPALSPAAAPAPAPATIASTAPAASAAPAGPAPAPQAATTAPAPAPSQPVAPQPQLLVQRMTQAFTPPVSVAPAAPPAPGTPAQMLMAATTQAAAQQQSAAPLLQTLSASLPHLPPQVAEAASRVLASRVNLDRGAPSGDALKQAVLKSGVFLDAPAKPGAPDIRQALGQLRSTLLAWLGDDIAPVAPIARRPAPPPPAKGTVPRGQPPELPQPPTEGGAKETARSLLSQTEGALARVKLMQLSTQPPDLARPGAIATPAEWNLELPMMLGHELAMAQIQIGRDGKGKSDARDKNWRLRFALRFSLIGEVGAQVSMVGRRTSVAIWADEDATADVLEAMLPELAPALAAKGLDLISLTVRRGVPGHEALPAGRLMDSLK